MYPFRPYTRGITHIILRQLLFDEPVMSALSSKGGRLEEFSDGVLAIIIPIMVLELEIPHRADIESLMPLMPSFLSYIYVGIYGSNRPCKAATIIFCVGGF